MIDALRCPCERLGLTAKERKQHTSERCSLPWTEVVLYFAAGVRQCENGYGAVSEEDGS